MNKFLNVLIFSVLFISLVESIDKRKDCDCWLSRHYKTYAGNFTWIANLYENDTFKCSGAILNENHVLFSKNCVKNDNGVYTVTVGEIKENDQLEKISKSNSIKVKNVNSRTLSNSSLSGITMMELASPIEFTKKLKPSCLEQFKKTKTYYIPFHLVGFSQKNELKEIRYEDVSSEIENCPENIICTKKGIKKDVKKYGSEIEFNSSGLAQDTLDGRTTVIGIIDGIDKNDKKQINLIRVGKYFEWILDQVEGNLCYIH